VDLAPESPVLDGDSGKPAGVAVRFWSLRSKPLMRIVQLEICQRLLRRTRPCLCRCAPNRSKIIAEPIFFCT